MSNLKMFIIFQVENKRLATVQQVQEFVKLVEIEMFNNYSDIQKTDDKVMTLLYLLILEFYEAPKIDKF